LKGIDTILAHGGRSEETVGIEADLDMDSITTGTACRLNMTNSTTGARFLVMRSGSSLAEKFALTYDGALTMAAGLTVTAGGLTVTAGGLTVTAGGLDVTGNAELKTGCTITGGLDVSSGASITSGTSISGKLRVTSGTPVDINTGVSVSSGLSVSGNAVFTGAIQAAGGVRGDLDLGNREATYVEYMEDFTDPGGLIGAGTSTPLVWTQTTGTTSPAAVTDGAAFGIMKLSGASSSAAGARCQAVLQHMNEFVTFVNNKKYYFEARVAGGANKFSKEECFVGLTNADTDLFALPKGAPDCTDWIGFTKFAGNCKWHFTAGTQALAAKASSTSIYNTQTATTGTYYRLGFKVDTTGTGTTVVTVYVDGTAKSAVSQQTNKAGTSYPYATALTWSAGISSGAAGGNTLNIDYINIICQR
jgi:hypothetical protein